MADDDIKPDADEPAVETTADSDRGGEAPTKQPADEAQASAEADAVGDDTSEVADAEAADSNLTDSNDDRADQLDAEDGASSDGDDAVAAESLDAAEFEGPEDPEDPEGSEGTEEGSDEETVDENLPPPGPPLR